MPVKIHWLVFMSAQELKTSKEVVQLSFCLVLRALLANVIIIQGIEKFGSAWIVNWAAEAKELSDISIFITQSGLLKYPIRLTRVDPIYIGKTASSGKSGQRMVLPARFISFAKTKCKLFCFTEIERGKSRLFLINANSLINGLMASKLY